MVLAASELKIARSTDVRSRIALRIQPVKDGCCDMKLSGSLRVFEQTQYPALSILLADAKDPAPIEWVTLDGFNRGRRKVIERFHQTRNQRDIE